MPLTPSDLHDGLRVRLMRLPHRCSVDMMHCLGKLGTVQPHLPEDGDAWVVRFDHDGRTRRVAPRLLADDAPLTEQPVTPMPPTLDRASPLLGRLARVRYVPPESRARQGRHLGRNGRVTAVTPDAQMLQLHIDGLRDEWFPHDHLALTP